MIIETLARVHAQRNVDLARGLGAIRRVVRTDASSGLTTRELFLAIKQKESANKDLPPKKWAGVKSLSFLKTTLLPLLQLNHEIKPVKSLRIPEPTAAAPTAQKKKKGKKSKGVDTVQPITTWVWKYTPEYAKEQAQQSATARAAAEAKDRPVYGSEVGIGEDYSHLNRRRLRARPGKIRRALFAKKAHDAFLTERARATEGAE
ncbi:hypothetical protein IW261DRAFT_1572898 [Armillaria novae-zelandiae]|uniref:Uncharacterized protein n=1 Tax=Armillaria novae-zelandiae TaxID=153914 RepID=A0AA39NRW7_9AGAR|nr:hypothetical protein IW261DRAFT_1572898 [Armillaria novae-zelandiae]